VSASPREYEYDKRLVSDDMVRITELVWPDERRSYDVHLVDGDIDLTENGCFDDPPTDAQIRGLIAEHRAATPLSKGASRADLMRNLLCTASARVGWQVGLDRLPVTCAHTPHLVVALIDASAAHLAAVAGHAALTDAARSVQSVASRRQDLLGGRADPDPVRVGRPPPRRCHQPGRLGAAAPRPAKPRHRSVAP
jgi:hypothetical protein